MNTTQIFLHTSVPAANLSNSNTPIGPFQMTVLEVSKASLNVLMDSGPISNPIQPSGMPEAGTICNDKGHLLFLAHKMPLNQRYH